MKTEILEINGINYRVNIHYENRDNSRVSIGRREINIRISLSLDREEMFKQVQNMKSWAIKKLNENPDHFKPRILREYNNGDLLKFRDQEYKLHIEFRERSYSSAKVVVGDIYLTICEGLTKEKQNKHISTLLSRSIARINYPVLVEKIKNLNEKHFKQKINNIYFKYNKSNWGSCSNAGNINISTRVLFAPDDVIEYICIHELAHLLEQNHSDNFWKLVKNAMPNYQEKKHWLKDNGNNCWF